MPDADAFLTLALTGTEKRLIMKISNFKALNHEFDNYTFCTIRKEENFINK